MNGFENFVEEKKTIDLVKANLYSILLVVPIAVFYFGPFYLFWKEKCQYDFLKESIEGLDIGILSITIILYVITFIGVVLHELIHGLTWAIFAKSGFKSIKFGFLLKMLTPYCHCKEPLLVKQYIMGAIMPFIILGIILGFIPAMVSIILGNIPLLLFGSVLTFVAMADFMVVNLLKKEDKNSYVLDHPSEAGFFIYREK